MKSQIYISCEMVQAEPMNESDFLINVKNDSITPFEEVILNRNKGFKVTYQDNQVAWIPEVLFKTFFRKLSANENTLLANSLIQCNDK